FRSRPADHLRPRGGQGAEPFLRGLVGTMLVPHRREDAKLGEGRNPADDLKDALIFVGLQPVRGNQVLGDRWFLHLVPRGIADAASFRGKGGRRKGPRQAAAGNISAPRRGRPASGAAASLGPGPGTFRARLGRGKKKAETKLGPSPTGR